MTTDDDYHPIQLYQKYTYPSGRVRYIPVEKIYSYELIQPNTTYLVKSLPRGGITTHHIREEIQPNYAPILSALRDFEEEACNILHEANEFKPTKILTQEELDAWAKLSSRHLVFEGISMSEFVGKLIKFLQDKINNEENNYDKL
jgi:hypothetical protein